MDSLDLTDWQRYRQGDHSAFARIYHRHRDHLLAFCVYSGHSRDAGEDIVQETFTRLARQERGEELRSVKNWLFICARNLSMNVFKKEKRELPIDNTTAISDSLSPETRQFIETVLNRLAPEERELILLREYHGFAVAELAAMFDATDEAIRVRLFRIRKRMAALGKECR